jgi:hypothetical protein
MRVLAENIVVLVYGDNNTVTKVVPICLAHEGIEVHCEEGIWKEENGTVHQIGEHRPCGRDAVRAGVIGVYDRSDIRQLNSMLYAAEYATRPPPCPFD